jgi:nucleoid DNA-binding protein
MSKKQTEAVLGDLVGLVTKHLKKGDRIRIGGLGILVVRKRAARMGRNPATGEPIQIKASKKVAFRPAKDAGFDGWPSHARPACRPKTPQARSSSINAGACWRMPFPKPTSDTVRNQPLSDGPKRQCKSPDAKA